MVWHFIRAKGVASGVVVIWREDYVTYKDVIKDHYTLSCLFECCDKGFPWMFTRVYCRGSRDERSGLWRELEECKNKWGRK